VGKNDITYLAIVPIAHLVLEDLLLLGLESLANAQPAATDGATDIADTAFLGELAGDVLIRPTLLLEVNNAGIVGIVVGLDGLGTSSLATGDADVALICEAGATVRVLVLLEEILCQWAGGDGSSEPQVRLLGEGYVLGRYRSWRR
jgi:hypothetical protein